MTRASIDPLSNLIRPRRLDLRSNIRGFIVGPWPQEHAQSFLHELTHHWCFHSPLGTILSLIRGEALALVFHEEDRPIGEQASADLFFGLATVDAILRFLRPLSEGLALFAEYDISPGASRIATTPMAWASLMFAPAQTFLNIDDPKDAETLERRLIDLRLARPSLRRKMGFLSRSFSPLDDAYYEGYLAVKRTYFDLLAECDLLSDTDLFLGYFRSYLFEDPGLIAILTAEIPLNERLAQALQRFRSRLEMLRDDDFSADIAAFAEWCDKPLGFRPDFVIPGIRSTEREIQDAREGLARMLARLKDDPDLSPSQRHFRYVRRGWLVRRSMATVLSEPVLVQLGPHGVKIWPDPRDEEQFLAILGTDIDHGLTPSSDLQPGWFSLVLLPHVPTLATVVGVADTVVAIQWRSGGKEPEPGLTDWLRDRINTAPYIEREAEQIGNYIRDYFENAPPSAREILDSFHAAIDAEWGRHNRAILRRWSSPPSDAAADALTHSDRLRGLYKRDHCLFETAVALSVLRSIDVLLPSNQAALAKEGWDVGAALMRVRDISEETGLMLLRNNDGSLEWTV